MSPIRTARPYAAKAIIEHEFEVDHLNIFVTFRFQMNQNLKPNNDLWLCIVNGDVEAVTVSAWQDAYTMLLTVPDIPVRPDRVTLAYDGPDENLKITWNKIWEPWGPIVSIELPPVSTTRTFSTGPAAQDDVDVANVNILFLDCSANDIKIGAFVNGLNGQILTIARLCPSGNDITLEHNKQTANQNIFLHKGLDETLTGEYGGWILACNGEDWFDPSHAKHIN